MQLRYRLAGALRSLATLFDPGQALFTHGFKKRYPHLELTPLETAMRKAAAVQRWATRANEISPVAKTPTKVRDLLLLAVHRNIELTNAFCRTCEAELFVPVFVLGRAIIETGALSWDTHNRIRAVLDSRDDAKLNELDAHVEKALLGSKSTHGFSDPNTYPAPNVLTLIDRITKQDSYDLRGFYDMLSEVAHPNLGGMHASYAQIHSEGSELRFHRRPFRELGKPVGIAVSAASSGLEMSVAALEHSNSTAGALAALCEESIKTRGTWPENVPYPVERPKS